MAKWQTLLIKEIRHLFRDTKTIIQTVVVPTFLTPLLIGGIVWYISSIAVEESKKDYDVAIYDVNNTQLITKFDEAERLNINKYESIQDVIDSVPLILMTGFGYDPGHSIVKARQAGVELVLFKPFRLDQLLETVERCVLQRPTTC